MAQEAFPFMRWAMDAARLSWFGLRGLGVILLRGMIVTLLKDHRKRHQEIMRERSNKQATCTGSVTRDEAGGACCLLLASASACKPLHQTDGLGLAESNHRIPLEINFLNSFVLGTTVTIIEDSLRK